MTSSRLNAHPPSPLRELHQAINEAVQGVLVGRPSPPEITLLLDASAFEVVIALPQLPSAPLSQRIQDATKQAAASHLPNEPVNISYSLLS